MKSADYRLAPDALIAAARAVVRNWEKGGLAQAVRELADALQQLDGLPLPILGVVVKKGRVESLVSDRPDVLAAVLQDAIVIDYGAVIMIVTRESVRRADIDLDDLLRELGEAATENK